MVSRLNFSSLAGLLPPSLVMRSSRSESSVGAEAEPRAWFDMVEVLDFLGVRGGARVVGFEDTFLGYGHINGYKDISRT